MQTGVPKILQMNGRHFPTNQGNPRKTSSVLGRGFSGLGAGSLSAARGGGEGVGVDGGAALGMVFPVEVGWGADGIAGVTDVGDGLADGDTVAGADGVTGVVGMVVLVAVVASEPEDGAAEFVRAVADDHAVGDGNNGDSGGGHDVNAFVFASA